MYGFINELTLFNRKDLKSGYLFFEKTIPLKKKNNGIKYLGDIGKMLGGYVKSLGVKYAKKI